MRRILATDFSIWPALQDLHLVSDAMLSPTHKASLANYLLLYDQIVIPTGNFQILPVLRLTLGEDVTDYLLRTRVIQLSRYDQWFGYVGNGNGLNFFQIQKDPLKPDVPPNMGVGFFAPLDEAIDIALKSTNPQAGPTRNAQLTQLLTDTVAPIPLETIIRLLKDETYGDILGSPYLRNFFSMRNMGRSLDNLIGINPDQVRICVPHTKPEVGDNIEIGSLLNVALENFILSIGTLVDANDIAGTDGTLTIVKAKGQRFGSSITGNDAFSQIQNINGIPDIGLAFANNQLSVSDLLKLRESKNTQAFRNWMGSQDPAAERNEIVQEFVSSLGRPSWIESLPAKLLRFGVTTGAGLLEPVTGTVVSAVDSFLLSRWFPGRSPRLFLKEAKTVLVRKPIVTPPSSMRGRERNLPCYCGSGKKYKKCHGR